MVGSGPHQEESMGSQCQDHFRILNDKGTGGEVYILPILVEAKLVVKAMFLRRRMPGTCKGRLIIWKEACAMNDGSELYLIMISLLGAKRMIVIGASRELHLMSPSPMMRIIIMNARIESRLRLAWEMMLWVKHSTKFPGRLSCAGSKEGDFLNGFLNPRSQCTTEGQILWSMLATSIKGWLYTPRTSLWCARCSRPV